MHVDLATLEWLRLLSDLAVIPGLIMLYRIFRGIWSFDRRLFRIELHLGLDGEKPLAKSQDF